MVMVAIENAHAAAMSVLPHIITAEAMRTVENLILSGGYEWVWDPMVYDVVGLTRPGSNRAVMILFLGEAEPYVEYDEEVFGE